MRLAAAWACIAIVGCGDEAVSRGEDGGDESEGESEAETVAVDPSKGGGPVETVGGLNYTGFARFASETTLDLLAALPTSVNRLLWAGDISPGEADPNDVPEPEEGVWDFSGIDAAVDVMVAARDATGADFILTPANAPGWMSVDGRAGNAPADFDQFAEYMARVVSYYNLGGFTDEYGEWHEGRGLDIHYWLIWNEPDDDNWGADVPAFGADEFADLFVRTSEAMRAADPTIEIGGPDTAWNHQAFLPALVDAGAQIDFVSIHRYGEGETDAEMLDDAENLGGVVAMASDLGGDVPVWVTETAPTWEEWTDLRNGSPFTLAWSPLAYGALMGAGAAVVQRWDALYTTFALVSDDAPLLPYWGELQFWLAAPAGSTRVGCEPGHEDLRCLATLDADGRLRVVVVNRGVAEEGDIDGAGVAHAVRLTGPDGEPLEGSFEAWVVDRTLDPGVGPAPVPGTGPVSLDGYGFAAFIED